VKPYRLRSKNWIKNETSKGFLSQMQVADERSRWVCCGVLLAANAAVSCAIFAAAGRRKCAAGKRSALGSLASSRLSQYVEGKEMAGSANSPA
jgi:hypothetical protein